jgi:2-amino-4-hydroxy-6-hydroxymethyldihydropteridine diphosphokinase
MNRAFLLTGANLGDRVASLEKAAALIQEHCGQIIQTSSLYETAAWGMEDQPPFLNQAHEISTTLAARQLMRRILRIEKMMGRVREKKYGPRLIDIDILFFNDEIHVYPLLRLPHPELHNRRFALQPMMELAPLLVHPVLKKNISHLLEECPDPLPVLKYK